MQGFLHQRLKKLKRIPRRLVWGAEDGNATVRGLPVRGEEHRSDQKEFTYGWCMKACVRLRVLACVHMCAHVCACTWAAAAAAEEGIVSLDYN